MSQHVPKSVRSIWPAVAILAVALGMLYWAQSYSETAARFPSIVAVVLAVLALIDIWSRTALPGQGAIAAFWGTGFDRREMTHDPPLRSEVTVLLWVIGAFLGFAVIGILAATPLFVTLYVWLQGRRRPLVALAAGLVVSGFQIAVFEWLLDYELYRGLLFSEGGFAGW